MSEREHKAAAKIQGRVAAAKIIWAGPLTMLAARSVLALVCQALVTAVSFRGSADG